MLNNLTINNIALISHLEISFGDNLNVLSGETGSGKSIIVDSLAFVLGERADKSLIKYGEQTATVEAVFTVEEGANVLSVMEELGFERDTTIIISRSMNINGRNECRLNGKVCSNTMLKQITIKLVDIFGQSQHLSLFKSETHIEVIDAFKKDEDSLTKLSELLKEIKSIDKQLREFGGSDAERERQIDILQFQIDEISKAKLTTDEEQQLLTKRVKIVNVEKIVNSLNNVLNCLSEGNNSAFSLVNTANSLINNISSLDEIIAKQSTRLNDCKFELMDIAETLEQFKDGCDFDANEIDRIEHRLDLYKSLCRKYGGSVVAVNEYMIKSSNELERLSNATDTINKLKNMRSVALNKAFDTARVISTIRKQSANEFAQLVMKQLIDLGMKDSNFVANVVSLNDVDEYNKSLDRNGIDTVEFIFSANKGEPLKPLVKVISGGEMSRFMLAVKNITAKIENIPTMIFDEIDTGISGKMAQMVAIKLSKVSRDYQSIVITHLPQIASIGDVNFVISKQVVNDRTVSSITQLDFNGKVKEVARLSGGETGTFALEHAKELISWADSNK